MPENVYEKAREVLRERGWAKGDFGSGDGAPVCLVGACNVALGSIASATLDDAYAEVLNNVIREQYPDFTRSGQTWGGAAAMWFAVSWNDQAAKSGTDADAILDKAARITDEQVRP